MGAAPIGMPGWLLFAYSTASTARKRMVSMAFFSSSGFRMGMCSLGNGRGCVTRLGQKGCFVRGEEGGAEPAVPQLGQDLRRDAARHVHSPGGQRLERQVARLRSVQGAERLHGAPAEGSAAARRR